MNNIVICEEYCHFINDKDETVSFETDMKNGNYQEWIKKYPDHLLAIFGAYLELRGKEIIENDIIYFVNKGVNLDTKSNVFRSDNYGTTPLGTACEFAMDNVIEILIKQGADVNLLDHHGCSPLDHALVDHSYNDNSCVMDVENCVKILMEAGAQNKILDEVPRHVGHKYELSEYLTIVLQNATIRSHQN